MEVSRREFLVAFAGGTATIAGAFLLPAWAQQPGIAVPKENTFHPTLAGRYAIRRTAPGGVIFTTDEHGVDQIVCEVNEHGFTILSNLDGKTTLHSLARILHADRDPIHLEHTEASVAAFVALMAQAGILSEPFYVNILAAEFTA
jgi:hypothetical protein